ncbi:MAG: hypothetical protein KTR31_25520 [Myxococcales bacterium]|nr:hypothetical protein [Myxococcales bacterium]
MLRFTLLALALGGCPRTPTPEPLGQPDPAQEVLARAQARTVPDALRARFGFKIDSEPLGLSGSTGGALIVDRPGRGHLAVLGPFGGPLAQVQTDGTGLAVLMPRQRQHATALDAGERLLALTEGIAGLPEVVDLFVGKVPLDAERITATEPTAEGLEITMAGPQDTVVQLVLEPASATPRLVDVMRTDGTSLLSATYGPFQPMEDGTAMPGEASFHVPSLQLQLDVRFKSWTVLEGDPPDVFSLAPPDGFSTGTLNVAGLLSPPSP